VVVGGGGGCGAASCTYLSKMGFSAMTKPVVEQLALVTMYPPLAKEGCLRTTWHKQ
jgi:hypothetical protein